MDYTGSGYVDASGNSAIPAGMTSYAKYFKDINLGIYLVATMDTFTGTSSYANLASFISAMPTTNDSSKLKSNIYDRLLAFKGYGKKAFPSGFTQLACPA